MRLFILPTLEGKLTKQWSDQCGGAALAKSVARCAGSGLRANAVGRWVLINEAKWPMRPSHPESHLVQRIGWLRADGCVLTAAAIAKRAPVSSTEGDCRGSMRHAWRHVQQGCIVTEMSGNQWVCLSWALIALDCPSRATPGTNGCSHSIAAALLRKAHGCGGARSPSSSRARR